MKYPILGLGLTVSLSIISTIVLAPHARAQSTTAAHVYIQIQGSTGAVYGFNASSTGKLSTISRSPFKPAGQIVDSTSTKFLTLGQTLIHFYGIASNGAIQSQLAQIPILDYVGSSCDDGPPGDAGAIIDHTGKYIYVVLEANAGPCADYQSYIINSNGSFAFDGDTEVSWSDGTGSSASIPSILGNESFAYANYDYLDSGPVVTGFRRESSGTLQLMQLQQNYPALDDDYYVASSPDASPTGNYVVLQLHPSDGGPTQFASYAVDSQGNISTTNTSSNMPTSSFV
jgi:hypothetical protein